jgi:hypothetical protein
MSCHVMGACGGNRRRAVEAAGQGIAAGAALAAQYHVCVCIGRVP